MANSLDERLFAALSVLASQPSGSLTRQEVWKEVTARVPLSDYEAERSATSSNPRAMTTWLFGTTGFSKAGWLSKSGTGEWTITDAGRSALVRHPSPAELAVESKAQYSRWSNARDQTALHANDGAPADLSGAFFEVLQLQARYSFTNTPDMVERRVVLGDRALPAVEAILRSASAPAQLRVQFSNGAGNPAKVPWLRIYDPAQSPSATAGWYVVFLFAADGSRVALSLNQGVTLLSAAEITQSNASAGRLLAPAIEKLTEEEQDRLATSISLNDPGLGRKYEAGHLVGFEYPVGGIPTDDVIANDLTSLIALLAVLPQGNSSLTEAVNTSVIDDEVALQQISDAIYWEADEVLEVFESLIDESPQLVLTGPPGTGKTFVAQHLAAYLLDMPSEVTNNPYIEIVQFHPSYGYEDFVEGLRPAPSASGGLEFQAEPGVLLRLVDDMTLDGHARVLIIDEMNRANLPKVFGELMFLLEYRDQDIRLTHRGRFSLPKNLYIIGTMNTADRSASGLDLALRRRFDFHEVPARADILRRYFARPEHSNALGEELYQGFESLNALLEDRIDRHHAVGHSYFMRREMNGLTLRRIWSKQLLPLIEEYFYDRPSSVLEFQIQAFWPSF